jgi:Rps23 Pro-64 3,4-dihydroxylase Tpa1-like proline 4-hydroxylase
MPEPMDRTNPVANEAVVTNRFRSFREGRVQVSPNIVYLSINLEFIEAISMITRGLITPDRKRASESLLPPYRCIRDFLKADEHQALLEFSIANEARFRPTVVRGNVIKPQERVSVGVWDFAPAKDNLRAHMMALVPQLIAELRVTSFVPCEIELELVAHGDGAFFKRHIDTFTGAQTKGKSARLISAVYYFYSEPKAFSGGALRLFRFGMAEGADDFIDIQPEQNALVVFPSWAPHEVLPISCPSGLFADSRFAVNFWIYATLDSK